MFDPPVMVVFGNRGSLASAHLSNFWAEGEGWSSQWGVHHLPCGPTYTGIWG